MNKENETIMRHYVVQINAPDGVRPLACFSDYDSAYRMARDIDWAQIVIYLEPIV